MYIYIYIYIITVLVVTKSLCGFVSNQVQYNKEGADDCCFVKNSIKLRGRSLNSMELNI